MAALQVRDLPERLYRKLALQAQKEHRSLSQEAIVVLEKGLGLGDEPKKRRQKLLEEITAHPPVQNVRKLPDPVDYLREDRKR